MRLLTVPSCSGLALLFTAFFHPVIQAQTHPEVLVVYNATAAASDSYTVASHYMAARNIPPYNLCSIAPPSIDSLSLSEYEAYVKAPIQQCLNALGSRNILYIVMSFMTPYSVIAGPQYASSVDSYIADIWDKYISQPVTSVPSTTQPYYADSQSQGNAYVPFQSFAAYRANPRNPLIYSVWRLDGPNTAIANALVDQAITAEASGGPAGQACIDHYFGDTIYQNDAGYWAGDFDLHQAATFLQQAGLAVSEDLNGAEFGTPPAPSCPDAAFYSGWYSYNNYNDGFTWRTGAVGWHLDSASALSPRSGSAWVPNALLRGIAVTSGAVSEPYLEGLVRPGGTFRNLLEGASVGDAFLRNTRWLKWEILNVGDPLYRPFPGGRAPFAPLQPVNSFEVSPQEVIGGTSTTGTITLSSPATGDGMTFVMSSQPGLSYPATVTVPAGSTQATFTINTDAVSQSLSTLIVAGGNGLTLKNTIILDPLLAGMAASSSTVQGGSSASATVRLNGRAPAGGTTIALSSNNAAVRVPASVKVSAGSTSGKFTVTTGAVSSPITATVTGTSGAATMSFYLTVTP